MLPHSLPEKYDISLSPVSSLRCRLSLTISSNQRPPLSPVPSLHRTRPLPLCFGPAVATAALSPSPNNHHRHRFPLPFPANTTVFPPPQAPPPLSISSSLYSIGSPPHTLFLSLKTRLTPLFLPKNSPSHLPLPPRSTAPSLNCAAPLSLSHNYKNPAATPASLAPAAATPPSPSPPNTPAAAAVPLPPADSKPLFPISPSKQPPPPPPPPPSHLGLAAPATAPLLPSFFTHK